MKKILLILISLAAIALLGYYANQEPEQLVTSAKVTRAPLAASLNVEGKTRLKQRFRVTAPIAGTIRRITLKVGDSIRKGQVIAEIEPTTANLLDPRSRSQVQADIVAAQAALRAAKQRTAAAKAMEKLAQQELTRSKSLLTKNVVSREQYDRAKAKLQSSQAERAAIQSEESVAQAHLEAARAQLDNAGKSLHDGVLKLTSPTDGRLIHRALESTQPISAGQFIMDIGDPSKLEIEADILSSQAVRLLPGMSAQVLRWGGKPLKASIHHIEPSGHTKISALGVEEQRTNVIFDINSPYKQWKNLGDGYRVDLEITTQSLNDALQIPLGALFRSDNGWAVYRIENGHAELKLVETGIKSNSHVQITQGLSEGEQVIIQPDAKIKTGSRVRGTP